MVVSRYRACAWRARGLAFSQVHFLASRISVPSVVPGLSPEQPQWLSRIFFQPMSIARAGDRGWHQARRAADAWSKFGGSSSMPPPRANEMLTSNRLTSPVIRLLIGGVNTIAEARARFSAKLSWRGKRRARHVPQSSSSSSSTPGNCGVCSNRTAASAFRFQMHGVQNRRCNLLQ